MLPSQNKTLIKYNLNLKSKVLKKYDGETLIESLQRRFTYHSRSYWLSKIDEGQIAVNNRVVASEHVLCEGDELSFCIPDFKEEKLDTDYKTIYEDDFVIIVNKPANLPVHSNRRFYHQTMTSILRREKNLPNLNPLHRLDRETSGLIVYLKQKYNVKKYRKNPGLIINKKGYLAIIKGGLPQNKMLIEVPLKEAGSPPVRYKMIKAPDGSEARTLVHTIAYDGNYSLVKIELLTGRKHQIRAHMACMGTYIVGDKLYSHDAKFFLKRCQDNLTQKDLDYLGSPHHLLHANYIRIITSENNTLDFYSPYFSDSFRKWINRFQLKPEQLELFLNCGL